MVDPVAFEVASGAYADERRRMPGGRIALPPLNLALSLFSAAIVAVLYLAAMIVLAGLADVALNGWNHLGDLALAMSNRGQLDVSENNFRIGAFVFGGLIYLAVTLAFVSLAWLRARGRWRELVAFLPWRLDRSFFGLLVAGLVYGIGASLLLGWLYPQAQNWFVLPRGLAGTLITIVLVAIFAPVTEEVVFRGWIYTHLRGRFGLIVTLVVTSLLFAVAHWENTHLYALVVFPMGLILGYVRERTGSIRASATVHGVYNLLAFVVTWLGVA